MLGVGLPDLLFIGLLFLLLVKPSEWPRVARKAAQVFGSLRRALEPVLLEMRGVRDSLMTESPESSPTGRSPSVTPPPDWAPSPQSHQKGGEHSGPSLPGFPPT